MTDCDTTSALQGQGKKRAFNLVKHNPELQTLEEVLLDSSSTPDAMPLPGGEFLLAFIWWYHHDAVPKHAHACAIVS